MQEFIETYKCPIIGGIIGLIIGILFLTLGFFKTILILLLTLVGVCIGVYLQKSQIVERFLSSRRN